MLLILSIADCINQICCQTQKTSRLKSFYARTCVYLVITPGKIRSINVICLRRLFFAPTVSSLEELKLVRKGDLR